MWSKGRLATYAVGRDSRKHIITKYNPDRNRGVNTHFGAEYYRKSTQKRRPSTIE